MRVQAVALILGAAAWQLLLSQKGGVGANCWVVATHGCHEGGRTPCCAGGALGMGGHVQRLLW
jgi:hypothetical protein